MDDNKKLAAPADLEALKALALAATNDRQTASEQGTALAAFEWAMCQTSPAVVLALIDRIAQAEESVAQYQQSAHELAEELRAARQDAALEALRVGQQAVPEGFVLMPKRLTKAMRDVLADEEWEWPDFLASAEVITEDEYNQLIGNETLAAPAERCAHCNRLPSDPEYCDWSECPAGALLQEKAAPAEQPSKFNDAQREAVRDALSTTLGDAMDCTRVWSAWGVGTMSQDDFDLLADNDERLEELVDAVEVAAFAAAELGSSGAPSAEDVREGGAK